MDDKRLKAAKELLVLLTKRYPLVGAARHSISLARDGELEVAIFHDGLWHPVMIEDADLERDQQEVFAEIVTLFDKAIAEPKTVA